MYLFSNIPSPVADAGKRPSSKSGTIVRDDGIKFQDMLAHFRNVQTKHERTRKQSMFFGGSKRRLLVKINNDLIDLIQPCKRITRALRFGKDEGVNVI